MSDKTGSSINYGIELGRHLAEAEHRIWFACYPRIDSSTAVAVNWGEVRRHLRKAIRATEMIEFTLRDRE